MSKAPENPRIFPREEHGNTPGQPGLSLRDYFAGQAIASATDDLAKYAPHDVERGATERARRAYILADAMLKARTETP